MIFWHSGHSQHCILCTRSNSAGTDLCCNHAIVSIAQPGSLPVGLPSRGQLLCTGQDISGTSPYYLSFPKPHPWLSIPHPRGSMFMIAIVRTPTEVSSIPQVKFVSIYVSAPLQALLTGRSKGQWPHHHWVVTEPSKEAHPSTHNRSCQPNHRQSQRSQVQLHHPSTSTLVQVEQQFLPDR